MIYPRIREMREDKDIKQAIVADYLNVKQGTYSKYELGQRNMLPDVLIKLAEFHDTSVDYLLGITDEKAPYKRAKLGRVR